MKRVKRRIRESPNPLFESWLREWKEEARKNGSEMQYCLGRALKSLQKFPFKLESGKECFILENFGTKLCMMLDKKLEEHNKETGRLDLRPTSVNSVSKSLVNADEEDRSIGATEVGKFSKKNIELSGDDAEENHCEAAGVANELVNKRKSCMDSPARSSKLPRANKNLFKAKERNKNSTYLPAYRSGGYAILLTLLKNSNEMTKAELEVQAQELCNVPFKKLTSASNTYYTAWSSMSVLIKKGLIERNGRPARYHLTTTGMATAMELQSMKEARPDNIKSVCDSVVNERKSTGFSDEPTDCNVSVEMNYIESLESKLNSFSNEDNRKKVMNECSSKSNSMRPLCNEAIEKSKKLSSVKGKTNDDCWSSKETIFLLPKKFDIILYVDTQEIENKQNVEGDKTVKYLRKRNVNFEVKHLSVGDYVWVCRDLTNNQELVLPYIVERKRMDDLASSIKDGRFHEQKFRLKQCGIQHCIYLVEKYGNDCQRLGLPLPTIQQAISNTKVIDRFDVKLTNCNEDSLSYLCVMTNFLTTVFKEKTLMSCSKKNLPPFNMSDEIISLMLFTDFNKESGKMRKFTVRNMLVKHLLQFSGLSVEKAKAIVKVYQTPRSLIEALQSSRGEMAVANIACGTVSRSIGPALAKSIHQLYTSLKLT